MRANPHGVVVPIGPFRDNIGCRYLTMPWFSGEGFADTMVTIVTFTTDYEDGPL